MNSSVDTFEQNISSYFIEAELLLTNSKSTLNSVHYTLQDLTITANVSQQSLSDSVQIVADAGNSLESIETMVNAAGVSLSAISIIGISPLEETGNIVTSMSSPIGKISENLYEVSANLDSLSQQTDILSTDLEAIDTQLTLFEDSVNQIQVSLIQTKNELPTYFNQARMAVLLILSLLIVVGIILIISGISVSSLRKAVLENNYKIEKILSQKTEQ